MIRPTWSDPTMSDLRARLVRLAHANPDLRPHLLPILSGSDAPRGVVAGTDRVAARDTMDFVTWALRTQRPVPWDRTLAFLERNGVQKADGGGETKHGQPLGEGEMVEIQANNAPSDLRDLLQPFHLSRGKVIKVEGSDIVVRFEGGDDTLRIPGGVVTGKSSGVYRTSVVSDASGMRLFEVVYLPAGESKPTQVSLEVLRAYIDRGFAAGEERSPNYYSGYIPNWKTSKEGHPYFMTWVQQRGGRPRTVSAKGQVHYIGLVGRRPPNWQKELADELAKDGMPLVASTRRTAGKVSVRFDNGLSVEDIEGNSPFGKVGQVAYLDDRRSGAKAAREAMSFARSNQQMLNAMSTGGQAIAAIDAHVYKATGKSPSWRYIQLPM